MNTIEQNKMLCERYPFLIPRNLLTDEIDEDYDYSYINGIDELPEGWNKLFLQMCEDIRQPLIDANCLETFRFLQIKEKYNRMRCYTFDAPETVYDIIMKYEYISWFVCQRCGKPATYEIVTWKESLCDNCRACDDCITDNDDKFVEVITFSPALEIDVSDIWNRLYK